ncbi:MAG: LysR family transcriptional regulator [Nitrospiraceae bacterium]|nr:LysR family transcriptional regulator [Nitrospiraceae bacterium]
MTKKADDAPGNIEPHVKLWFSSPRAEGVFGDGKWRLLQAIDREGSLRAATQALQISYRKAWGDLRKAEKFLGVRFIERRRGGAGGGEAYLTKDGRAWVAAYGRFRAKVEAAVEREFEAQIAGLQQPVPKETRRRKRTAK